jgi:hypothetical protein
MLERGGVLRLRVCPCGLSFQLCVVLNVSDRAQEIGVLFKSKTIARPSHERESN